jgi:large subunit ribosomal protein L4
VQIPVYDLTGKIVKHIEVNDRVFAVSFNQAVVHQAVVRQRANLRQGTASTKTRGKIAGSGRKLFRQKHTGFARAGNKKSPLRRGGGVVFGPHPRDYRQSMPRKMRQLAIRCVLSSKAGEGELRILEQLKFKQPKTREIVKILMALEVDSSTLLTTSKPDENIIKSTCNLKEIKTITANTLNVVDILSHKMLVMTEDAVREVERLWGGNNAPLRSIASSINN